MTILSIIGVLAIVHLYYINIRRTALMKEGVDKVKEAITILDDLDGDLEEEFEDIDKRTEEAFNRSDRRMDLLAESLGMEYQDRNVDCKVTKAGYVKATKKKKALRKS